MTRQAHRVAGAMNEFRRQFISPFVSRSRGSASLSMAIILLAASVFQAGCATYTLDRSECLSADWESIGYADGQAGYPAARFAEHEAACVRHDVVADPVAYDRGRERGLTAYCTGSSGFEVGRRGETYQGVCPKHLEDDFLNAYDLGGNVRRVEQAIVSAERNIQAAALEIQQARNWTPQQELDRKLNEIDRQYSRERDRLSQDITGKTGEIQRLRKQLAEAKPEMDTTGIQSNIRALEMEIEDLQTDRRYLPSDYERRRGDVRVDHERSREQLIRNNNAKMEAAIRRRSESEERRAELETELSGLMETKDGANY